MQSVSNIRLTLESCSIHKMKDPLNEYILQTNCFKVHTNLVYQKTERILPALSISIFFNADFL